MDSSVLDKVLVNGIDWLWSTGVGLLGVGSLAVCLKLSSNGEGVICV